MGMGMGKIRTACIVFGLSIQDDVQVGNLAGRQHACGECALG